MLVTTALVIIFHCNYYFPSRFLVQNKLHSFIYCLQRKLLCNHWTNKSLICHVNCILNNLPVTVISQQIKEQNKEYIERTSSYMNRILHCMPNIIIFIYDTKYINSLSYITELQPHQEQ